MQVALFGTFQVVSVFLSPRNIELHKRVIWIWTRQKTNGWAFRRVEGECLFDCSGVGIDYYGNRVYFSDSTGGVYVKDLSGGGSAEDSPGAGASSPGDGTADGRGEIPSARTPRPLSPRDGVRLLYQSSAEPRALSVDWLHHKLYVAENNKVSSMTHG